MFISKIALILVAIALCSKVWAQDQAQLQIVPQPQPQAIPQPQIEIQKQVQPVVQSTQAAVQAPDKTQVLPVQPSAQLETQNIQATVQQTIQVESAGGDANQPASSQSSDPAQKDPNRDIKQQVLPSSQQQKVQQKPQQFNYRQQVEARMAYQKFKKEMEETKRLQQIQLQRIMQQSKIRFTEQIKSRERTKFIEAVTKLNQELGDIPRDNYMFQLEANTFVDFHLVLSQPQEIAFYAKIYSTSDGIIKEPTIIQIPDPIQVFVYEDNIRLKYTKDFLFVDVARFKGKAESNYTIKFVTRSESRLVDLTITRVVQQSHVAHSLSPDDFIGYASRTKSFYNQISQRSQELHRKHVMFSGNRMKLNQGIRTYYLYTIFQMVLVGALCVIQVEVVRKMLDRSSVV